MKIEKKKNDERETQTDHRMHRTQYTLRCTMRSLICPLTFRVHGIRSEIYKK